MAARGSATPSQPRLARRRAALRQGALAEWIAAGFLMLKGYRLLARRHGGKGGEIDLILTRGSVVIFVEVKARATREAALDAITPAKQRFMRRTVRAWLARNPWAADRTLRADAVLVRGVLRVEHVTDLFPLDEP